MAAAILHTSFYGDDRLEYQITIYDRDLSIGFGTVDFYTDKGSNVITDDGDDNDTFKRIITKKYSSIILLSADDYTPTQKTALVNFFNNLCNSPEGRFYIQINQGSSIIFRGKILADIGDLTLNYHKELSITATDGISQLKGIDYKPTQGDNQLLSISQHISRILMKNDVANFFWSAAFNQDDALFSTATFWICTEYSGDDDILSVTHMYNHYYEPKSVGKQQYKKYWNCYDVLEDILTGFNARILFADGMWHIEQLGYLDNLNVERTAYHTDGNIYNEPLNPIPGNKITHNITSNDNINVLADIVLKRIAPFKAVSLKQNKAYYNIIAGHNIFFHRTDPDERGPHNLGYQIINGNSLVGDLIFECEHNLPYPDVYGYVGFEIQIKLGSFYLMNPNNDYIITNTLYPAANYWQLFSLYWTNTPSTIKIYVGRDVFAKISSKSFQFDTDVIPEEGELIFTLVRFWKLDGLVGNEDMVDTPKLIKWNISQKSRLFLSTNNLDAFEKVPDDTIIYEIGDSRNTIVYETSLRFFDDEFKESALIIRIPSGNLYVLYYTTSWTDPDMGETLPIQKLVLKQMLGMRSYPQRLVRQTLIRRDSTMMHFDDRYAISGQIYIPIRQVHNLDNGTYQLSLWSIYKDFDGINVEEFSDVEENKYVVAFDNNLNSPPPSMIDHFYLKYTNVNTTTINTMDQGISLLFYFNSIITPETIDEQLDVFQNGVRLEYVDLNNFTFPLTGGELQMNQYTMDLDYNLIYFAYNEASTIILKYVKF